MADFIKALVLFTFGFAILANLGDALDKKDVASGTQAIAATVTPGSALPHFEMKEDRAEFQVEKPSQERTSVVRTGSYAQVCASFDPIARPEEIIDILEYASETTGTPVDVLFAVWQKETGFLHGDGRMSGGCDLKKELTRRDRAAGTDHWNAMLAMADHFGWKQRYGSNLENMTCSCPAKDKETGLPKGYGGCCGPFQFSGNEVAHQYAIPYGLDPMTFCGGALIAGWELKKHHDNAFKPDRRFGRRGRGGYIMDRHGYTDPEHARHHASMGRYYGADTGDVYGSTAVKKWQTFHEWYRRDQLEPGYLISKILGLHNTKYSLRKLRAKMAYASNP